MWVIKCSISSLALCADFADGDIRLVGGVTDNEGRVEVYQSGAWGTVCDDSWDINDAMVVCRQLGFDTAAAANGLAAYGPGTGPIHYDNVACTGNETRLADCPHNGVGIHNCVHFEDAGVVCGGKSCTYTTLHCRCSTGLAPNLIVALIFSLPYAIALNVFCVTTYVAFADGDVRLVDGPSSDEGRVEVFFSGAWGTVCDDGWDVNDATVVCRQIGHFAASSAPVQAAYGPGTGPIWLDDVDCIGNETSISQCGHIGVGNNNCFHSEDAGAVCTSKPRCHCVVASVCYTCYPVHIAYKMGGQKCSLCYTDKYRFL